MNANRGFTITRMGLVQMGENTVINYWVRGEGIEPNWPSRRIAWSQNGGLNWQESAVENDSPPATLCYGNGVIVGPWADQIIRSTDGGRTFSQTAAGQPVSWFSDLMFTGELFVAWKQTPTVMQVFASADGETWWEVKRPAFDDGPSVRAVAFQNDRYYLGGSRDGGLIPLLIAAELPKPPILLASPLDQEVAEGRRLRLEVEVTDPIGVKYQWFKNSRAIAGATTRALTIESVTEGDAGFYRCKISNSAGSVTSNTATVDVFAATRGGRLVNLSVNTLTGPGDKALNLGFVVHGSLTKSLLMRAVGPGLEPFGVTDALADPQITVMTGERLIGRNDNWANDDGHSVGAFALSDGSLDAAMSGGLEAGIYSVVIGGAEAKAGRVLAEIYDRNLSSAESLLTNLSVRAEVEQDETLIVGFVIGGTRSLSLVVRAIGPSLAAFGISNPLADPHITLYSGGGEIANNDDWSGSDGRELGAFPLVEGSKDGVLSVTLAPGIYTVHVKSAEPTAGAGLLLVELYDAN